MTVNAVSRARLIDASLHGYPPFGLRAQNFFVARPNAGLPIFMKKIFSLEQEQKGAVIMAPGISSNGNLFRIRVNGDVLTLDHNESFANLLAASGYTVYLYHPSYCQRVIERYVIRHCKIGDLYGQSYKLPNDLTIDTMVEDELPFIVEEVFKDNGGKPISWIGFSLGGMLIYGYLPDDTQKKLANIVTICSPTTLDNSVGKVVGGLGQASRLAGLSDKLLTDRLTSNLLHLSQLAAKVPTLFLRYNLATSIVLNPRNITNAVMHSLVAKVAEPIPAGLQLHFTRIVAERKFISFDGSINYLEKLRQMDKSGRAFLLFWAGKDHLVSERSVRAAHEALTPGQEDNLICVEDAGHDDAI